MERNRLPLERALRQLPQYDPPANIWTGVSKQLDQYAHLRDLPQYEPSDNLWEQIANQLPQTTTSTPLGRAIQQLPQYEPPALLWEKIATELPTRSATVIRVKWWRYAAAAAIIGILATVGLGYLGKENAKVTIAHSTEIHDPSVWESDWYEDESAFDMILAFCKTQTFTCEEPLFRQLQSELQELNTARSEIESVMGDYGQDTQLLKQLTRIEHQRSDVLKEMAKLI
ncbi:MAG: hypothetical protein AAGK47_02700 [Bacteroidota bacterium]